MAISNLLRERLRLEAEQTVGKMSYSAICDICPRSVHWMGSVDEYDLAQKQRRSARKTVFERLVAAAEKDALTESV